jgi:hypothetical protein
MSEKSKEEKPYDWTNCFSIMNNLLAGNKYPRKKAIWAPPNSLLLFGNFGEILL